MHNTTPFHFTLLCTHTFLYWFLLSLPISPLHLRDIFRQTISPLQRVGRGIWIFIAHRRRCRSFNLDYSLISTHSDSAHDLEAASMLWTSLDTQLLWTHIINVRLIKVTPFQDWAELCNFLTRVALAFIIYFILGSSRWACFVNSPSWFRHYSTSKSPSKLDIYCINLWDDLVKHQ